MLLLPGRKVRATAEPPPWLGLGTAMIPMNQESLVGAGHQPASITSLPFVDTARRYYPLNDLVRAPDGWGDARSSGCALPRLKAVQT